MTRADQRARPPARHSLAWSLLLAVAVAFVLVIALRAPMRAASFDLPRPEPRPPLLDVPVISPTTGSVKSPKR
ncbi:MAG TPA: hypothetical protein VFK05_33190 [Polyangiaceae bacterium]|nr:hypothetical protein [Polyangiaceae bacterium]